ncbi:hypothetical protein BS78_02G185800 [Paspalum vaginatum]|nr:hypothetical protein BS78_02G185800 [Paspalum vaginatum]
MEFACRGRPAADEDGDGSRRSSDTPLPHDLYRTGTGDAMLVIKDALLLQLQKDRLRQEIIVAELAKLDRAMAQCSAAPHGVATARMERPEPVLFTFSEESTLRSRWPISSEHYFSNVDHVHGLKKKDVNHGDVQLKSEKSATEDISSECARPCCSNGKADDENAVFDQQNLQEPNAHCAGKKHRSNVAAMESRNKAISQKAGTTTEPSSCADQKTFPIKWSSSACQTILPKASSQKLSCAICQVETPTESHLQQHFAGQKHWSKVANLVSRNNENGQKAKAIAEQSGNVWQYEQKALSEWFCRFCQSNCTCKSDLESHLRGKRHKARIHTLLEECKNIAGNYASSPETEADSSTWNCSLCQAKCNRQSELADHLRGKRHLLNFLLLQVEAKQYLSEWGCGICQAKCNSASQFEDHCSSMGHRQKVEAIQRGLENVGLGSFKMPASSEGVEIYRMLYFCKLCNLHCDSKNMLAEHRRGRMHTQMMEKRMFMSFCEVCNVQCNSEKMLAHHRTGKTHLAKLHGC